MLFIKTVTITTNKEVAIVSTALKGKKSGNKGTITKPPPTPKKAEERPMHTPRKKRDNSTIINSLSIMIRHYIIFT